MAFGLTKIQNDDSHVLPIPKKNCLRQPLNGLFALSIANLNGYVYTILHVTCAEEENACLICR